ncbi:AAA family ATPase [Peribacillus castrilensis]|uniref:AAA family ATPase n=1 Tax=Bacillaceae TaxID=186817 RepID=UPI00069D7BEA|nr:MULTISPECIES: AAA family ATPase [Bacillaceae]PRA81580.1 hypothetical protein CQ056_20480 [Peribacillus simplex]
MSHETEKSKLLHMIFENLNRSYYKRIESKKIKIRKRRGEIKTDEMIERYPKLKYFRYLFLGYFSTKKIFKLVALIPIGILLFSFVTHHFSFEPISSLIYLLFIYGVLAAGIGGIITGYQRILAFLSKGSEIETYKRNLVNHVNRVMDLVEHYSFFTGYDLSYDSVDWLTIKFYKKSNRQDHDVLSYYVQAYLNTGVYGCTEDHDQLRFNLQINGKEKYSAAERGKELTYLKQQLNECKQVEPQVYSEGEGKPMDVSSKEEHEQLKIEEINSESLLDESLHELEKMTGLEPVKEKIKELTDMISLEKERNRIGQSLSNQSLHMMFTGNPGTGKTTVARIMAKILKAIGVISKGHLVEVTRQDLVGEYVGHTAPKTRRIIDKAIGGVLFIDEAYSLSRGSNDDFGKEAIDELVRGMEEHRSDLIVILAGYTKEMNEFLKTNSGLKSRMPNAIEFPDYRGTETIRRLRGHYGK